MFSVLVRIHLVPLVDKKYIIILGTVATVWHMLVKNIWTTDNILAKLWEKLEYRGGQFDGRCKGEKLDDDIKPFLRDSLQDENSNGRTDNYQREHEDIYFDGF